MHTYTYMKCVGICRQQTAFVIGKVYVCAYVEAKTPKRHQRRAAQALQNERNVISVGQAVLRLTVNASSHQKILKLKIK